MKTLRDAVSYSYCTKNERGWEEVSIKFKPTIWDRWFFKGRGKEMVFVTPPGSVYHDVRWLEKDSLDVASNAEKMLIEQVIRLALYSSINPRQHK